MIARTWIGEVREANADAYFKYLEETGIKECKAIVENQGVWLLRRVHNGKAEFISFLCGTHLGNASHVSAGIAAMSVIDPDVDGAALAN